MKGYVIMEFNVFYLLVKTVAIFFLFGFSPVYAYIGPGAGLTAIGSFIALAMAILVAVVGFLWFPVKRMLKKRSNRRKPDDSNNG